MWQEPKVYFDWDIVFNYCRTTIWKSVHLAIQPKSIPTLSRQILTPLTFASVQLLDKLRIVHIKEPYYRYLELHNCLVCNSVHPAVWVWSQQTNVVVWLCTGIIGLGMNKAGDESSYQCIIRHNVQFDVLSRTQGIPFNLPLKRRRKEQHVYKYSTINWWATTLKQR